MRATRAQREFGRCPSSKKPFSVALLGLLGLCQTLIVRFAPTESLYRLHGHPDARLGYRRNGKAPLTAQRLGAWGAAPVG